MPETKTPTKTDSESTKGDCSDSSGKHPNHYINETVIRVHSKPDGWQWYSVDVGDGVSPDGYLKITGCVPDGVYRSGERKGRTKWNRSKGQTVFISTAELEHTKRMIEL